MSPVREWISAYADVVVLLEPDYFDEAIVGLASRADGKQMVVYDRAKCIALLMAQDGMDEEGAIEFFDFNTAGAWMGDNTPAFLETMPDG